METKISYSRYLDGKTMYSMGRLEKPVLTEEGWQVQPSHPATEHERMVGAAEMRSAFQSMLKSGGPLPEEVARDVAHWLLVLNDGRATGIFVPLALAADGAPATIDSATPDTIAARIEIAASLESFGAVPASYVPAISDALHRADRGRLTGLAAPLLNHFQPVNFDQHQTAAEPKLSSAPQPKYHIQYIAQLHRQYPKATSREILKICIEAARNSQSRDDEQFPFHLVRGQLAPKGTQRTIAEHTFANWFSDAKKLI